MKQLLFLLLFPCLAMAQYPGNGNQKITLGEQTTADGLVYRGLVADTTRKPSVDTMAYIILDTTTNLIWHYKKGTSNAWLQAGGGVSVSSFSAGTTGLTPSTATTGAVTLGGTLAVANGGTGSATQNFVDLTTAQTVGGAKTFNAPFTFQKATGSFPGNNSKTIYIFQDVNGNTRGLFGYAASTTNRLSLENSQIEAIVFGVNNTSTNLVPLRLDTTGKVMVGGDIAPSEALDVNGNGRIRSVGTALNGNSALYVTSEGVLSTNSSDVNKKHNIRNLPYGLSTINNLNPVTFEWNETDETDIGFIAQDIENVIPESVITNWDSQLIFRQEKIIPVLVKAIQEQNALIKALEQRILTLENK